MEFIWHENKNKGDLEEDWETARVHQGSERRN